MSTAVILERNRSTASGLIRLIRPKQWTKNGFVLAPLVFSQQFTSVDAIGNALAASTLFCLAASIIYVLNDYHDIERDRLHPVKSKTRPLAAEQVSEAHALVLLAVLVMAVAAGFVLLPWVGLVIMGYLLLNLAYTLFLKNQPVVDIFVIATGFVLRVYAGAVALLVPVSSWMFVTTLCLALYLAAVKRRQELLHQGTDGRQVLEQYSIGLVDRYAEMSAIGALMFYSLFVVTARPELVITVPFVIYGFFRYWFLVEQLDGGESPTEALLSDWQLLATVTVWGLASGVALWPGATW